MIKGDAVEAQKLGKYNMHNGVLLLTKDLI